MGRFTVRIARTHNGNHHHHQITQLFPKYYKYLIINQLTTLINIKIYSHTFDPFPIVHLSPICHKYTYDYPKCYKSATNTSCPSQPCRLCWTPFFVCLVSDTKTTDVIRCAVWEHLDLRHCQQIMYFDRNSLFQK
jgi:hypothetical protein